MVVVHRRDIGRTPTGGRAGVHRGKRRFEIGDHPTATRIDKETRIVAKQTKARSFVKAKVHTADHVNLFDPKTKTFSQAKVMAVVECPANRHYVRRNVMVRGAVVQTEKGKARITSRPGQDGTVNAVLV
jgi:small subunit ribosomal protein S8e